MANEQQAAADARHFLSQFRSLFKFAESVQDLGDVDGRLAGLKSEEAGLVKKRDDVKAQLATEQKKLEALKAAAAAAKKEADSVFAGAKYKIDAMLADAHQRAKKIMADAEAKKAEAENEVLRSQTRMNEERKVAEKALGEVLAKRETVLKEIEALRRRIA